MPLSSALDLILEPVEAASFLESHFSQEYLFVNGPSGKFHQLMSWGALNGLLGHQYLRSFLRLVKDGKRAVDLDTLFHGTSVSAADLTKELRQGATLILNRMDEIHKPITALCANLERSLDMPVRATMYAGWRTIKGFNIHADEHDVFILQISGSKQWKVYTKQEGPGTTSPDHTGTSDDRPVWQGLLTDGDLLYIPRGWPHVAIPCNEPTLHLTIGMHNGIGLDLVGWIVHQVRSDPRLTRDIPRFQGLDARRTYLDNIRSVLTAACSAADTMDLYQRDLSLRAQPRAMFGLPWTATPDILPSSDKYVINLCLPRLLQLRQSQDNEVMLDFDRRTLVFGEATVKLLRYLEGHSQLTLAQFYRDHSDQYDHSELVGFLTDLAKEGVIVLSEPAGG